MVGRQAEKDVDTQSPPFQCPFQRLRHHVTVCSDVAYRISPHALRSILPASQIHHITHPRGAIIAEEVVAIVTVFRQIVLFQQQIEVVHLPWRAIEPLLPYRTTIINVFLHECLERRSPEHIVQLSAHELPVEMRRVEIESTVVIDQVETLSGVAYADGTVSKGGVEIISWAAGQLTRCSRLAQRHLRTQWHCCCQQRQYKQQPAHNQFPVPIFSPSTDAGRSTTVRCSMWMGSPDFP